MGLAVPVESGWSSPVRSDHSERVGAPGGGWVGAPPSATPAVVAESSVWLLYGEDQSHGPSESDGAGHA
jgi:hypothetical protein